MHNEESLKNFLHNIRIVLHIFYNSVSRQIIAQLSIVFYTFLKSGHLACSLLPDYFYEELLVLYLSSSIVCLMGHYHKPYLQLKSSVWF
jgi:hypothetical protein